MYVHELQHKLLTTTGTMVDCATICRTLKRLGFSIRYIALQQSEEKRIQFTAEVIALKAEVFVWLD